MKSHFLLIILLALLSGCDKLVFDSPPANTPENNFEIFWKDFDMYYAQFKIRHVNWDSMYTVMRPQVTPGTTDEQLFDILSRMVLALNDMHVTLYTPLGDTRWIPPYPEDYPSSRFINAGMYVSGGEHVNAVMEYEMCRGSNYGYIAIYTFEGDGNGLTNYDARYLVIDDIMKRLRDTDGLVIDVRWNGGGNSPNEELVADRFADKKRVYMKSKYKNGPGPDDFSGWHDWYVIPEGNYPYTKPIVVLTSRATSSTAESFVLAMHALPNVMIVGDTTGGGLGIPIFRELPNGWTYRLSTAIGAAPDGRIIDGHGIIPDVSVRTTIGDANSGTDRIIEKALKTLGQRN